MREIRRLRTRTLWLANAINIVLDPCLINGWGPFPRLGVMGAAVATTTGRGIGVIYQIHALMRGTRRVRIRLSQIRLNLATMTSLIRVSLTGMIQFLISTASWLALIRIASLFGTAAVAGYGLGIRIFMFVILPSWGLSNAAATLVGQNLGAGHPEPSEKSVYQTGFYTCYMALYVGGVSDDGAAIAGFFTAIPRVLPVADAVARAEHRQYLLRVGHGAGPGVRTDREIRDPVDHQFLLLLVFQIPLAWSLAILAGLGPKGVFSSIPAA